tara:strand:- start:59767 stop:59991 length:225 start_codon:yes stop_codon:yes gene_type:complete
MLLYLFRLADKATVQDDFFEPARLSDWLGHALGGLLMMVGSHSRGSHCSTDNSAGLDKNGAGITPRETIFLYML